MQFIPEISRKFGKTLLEGVCVRQDTFIIMTWHVMNTKEVLC